jgi:hypothetical protein
MLDINLPLTRANANRHILGFWEARVRDLEGSFAWRCSVTASVLPSAVAGSFGRNWPAWRALLGERMPA